VPSIENILTLPENVLAAGTMVEEGGRNPSFGERKCIATCHPVIAQSNWSKLVK